MAKSRFVAAMRGMPARLVVWVELLGHVIALALTAFVRPLRLATRLGELIQRAWPSPTAAPRAAAPPATTAGTPPDEHDEADEADGPADLVSLPPPAAETERPARLPRTVWRVATVYVLVVLAWSLFTVMHRVDSALRQMTVGGQTGGGALGFRVSLGGLLDSIRPYRAQAAVDATQAAWSAYRDDVTHTRVLRDPFDVAAHLVRLDVCYVIVYTALLVAILVTLGRLNQGQLGRSVGERQRTRRLGMLRGAGGLLALLVVVDLGEDVEIYRTLVHDGRLVSVASEVALGPLLSALKTLLAIGVLVPVGFVALVLATQSRPLRRTVVSIRGVLYAVGGLVVLLMFGLGAAQLDDVVRAWDGWRALWAAVAATLLALTITGIARHLSGSAREYPAPDIGRTAQPVLLGAGVLLFGLGQVLRLAGWGWGISAAGAVLIGFWALGLLVDGVPRWPALPAPLPAGRPGLVFAAVSAVGAVVGGTVGGLAGPAGITILFGALVGAVVALMALAVWSLWDSGYDPDSADPESAALAGELATALRVARAEAARALKFRDDARDAAARGDMAAWSASAEAAEKHAALAERRAEDARAIYMSRAESPASARRSREAADRAAGIAAAARHAALSARESQDAREIAVWGDRVGRVAGAAVAAVLVVAISRATALDAYVASTPNWAVVRWPLACAVVTGLVGLVVCAYEPRSVGRKSRPWPTLWFLSTAAALVCGGTLFLWDAKAVAWAEAVGSVTVLFGGVTLFAGVLALLAVGARRGAITRYALAPAFRTLRFERFPVVLFLLVWAVVVSGLDSGGYHDIRRQVRPGMGVAPTLYDAWQQYVAVGAGQAARPVVFVAAQGGGIRSAVWTALVMECLFGPGPVADSVDLCAEGTGRPDPRRLAETARQPLPVFLASGASGGSVGLAAWSARRADLVQDGASSRTPKTVEQALDRDFVAPDVARLLLVDLPRTLLAWPGADRAEMLERGWERPWHAGPDRGLTRGLRQTWNVTHTPGTWNTPVLAFNGASVEDTCRFIASAVDFVLPRKVSEPTYVASTSDRPNDAACRGVAASAGEGLDVLPSTNELVDYLCPSEDVPMSTAAHLSARFPYVSPTGRVARHACPAGDPTPGLVPQPALSYIADGGIFDNAGAGTAADTWRALAPLAAATERQSNSCLVPIFVQIDNSAPTPVIASAADPRPNELAAPIGATFNQVSSREGYARSGAAAAFGRMVSADGRPVRAAYAGDDQPDSLWFRITLYGQPGPEPPTGWTLAPETVAQMRSQLRATSNTNEIKALRQLLRPGGLACG